MPKSCIKHNVCKGSHGIINIAVVGLLLVPTLIAGPSQAIPIDKQPCSVEAIPLLFIDRVVSQMYGLNSTFGPEEFKSYSERCGDSFIQSGEPDAKLVLDMWSSSPMEFQALLTALNERANTSSSDVALIHQADAMLFFSLRGNDDLKRRALEVLQRVQSNLASRLMLEVLVGMLEIGGISSSTSYEYAEEIIDLYERDAYGSCYLLAYAIVEFPKPRDRQFDFRRGRSIYERVISRSSQTETRCKTAELAFCGGAAAYVDNTYCSNFAESSDKTDDPLFRAFKEAFLLRD